MEIFKALKNKIDASCGFCSINKDKEHGEIITEGLTVIMALREDMKLILNVGGSHAEIEINNCPMCGRKLR